MLAMTERTSKDSDDLCMRLLTNGKGCFMIWEEGRERHGLVDFQDLHEG